MSDKGMNLRRLSLLGFIVTVVSFAVGFLVCYFAATSTSNEECRSEKRVNHLTSNLMNLLDATRIENFSRFFSSQPHYAGSERQKELADEIKKTWENYGFVVQMPEYDVLLSIPDENNPDYIKVVNGTGKLMLKETFVTQAKADPRDNKTWNIPRYFFYSPSRHVEGGLLYVNTGRKEDFELLKSWNISCNGSIVLLKHRRDAVDQLKNAFECNAEGVILFYDKDPNDELETRGNNTYPNGIWLPRDSPFTTNIKKGIGDPLTPGLPSTTGIYRVDEKQIKQWPKLPVQLVDYNVAMKLLQYLKGPKMPNEWRPKSNKTKDYCIGPDLSENATFYLAVNTKTRRQKVYNVIGTVYGKEEPDHWVLIGNHRDSIAFGGADAVSGTAGMMEVSHGIKELLKTGWRPRRTIKFCSWAAEEAGLIGSNEWVEENIKLLQERAVAYINMDLLVHGNYSFKAKGNPMLRDLIFSQTKLVHISHDPGNTIYSNWNNRTQSSNDPSIPNFVTSGGSTDYQPFYELAGVPCLDLQYTPQDPGDLMYPTYHTPYDTQHWIRLIDPYFKIHLAQAQLVARLVFNLTESHLLPFNLTFLSSSMEEILQRTRWYYDEKLKQHNITLNYISEEAKKLGKTIKEFEKRKNQVKTGQKYEQDIRMLNRRMVGINKMFLTPEDVPRRPGLKHVLYGISDNMFYPNITLVAISNAVIEAENSGNWEDVKHQVSMTLHCIKQARDALQMPLNT